MNTEKGSLLAGSLVCLSVSACILVSGLQSFATCVRLQRESHQCRTALSAAMEAYAGEENPESGLRTELSVQACQGLDGVSLVEIKTVKGGDDGKVIANLLYLQKEF